MMLSRTRSIRPLLFAAALTVAGTLSACVFDVDDGQLEEAYTLRVQVAGGVDGVAYAFELRGEGPVLGVSCNTGCSYAAGDTLRRLTTAQRDAVRRIVFNSGLPSAGRPTEFGEEIDELWYRLIFTSGTLVRSFSGSPSNLPAPLRTLVRAVQNLYEGAPPVVLSQSTGLTGFGRDPVSILSARVESGVLALDVTYGGGCIQHDLDAVVWTDFMESTPIQVGVALAHDAHGDTCKALVQRTLRFDLEPLRIAYSTAYGASRPASFTLRVEPAQGAPGTSPTLLTFSY